MGLESVPPGDEIPVPLVHHHQRGAGQTTCKARPWYTQKGIEKYAIGRHDMHTCLTRRLGEFQDKDAVVYNNTNNVTCSDSFYLFAYDIRPPVPRKQKDT